MSSLSPSKIPRNPKHLPLPRSRYASTARMEFEAYAPPCILGVRRTALVREPSSRFCRLGIQSLLLGYASPPPLLGVLDNALTGPRIGFKQVQLRFASRW